jgi:hypothetical protein
VNRKRRLRFVLALYLGAGAFVTQLGACFSIGANTGAASFSQNLIDANGNVLGIFNVCGLPDIFLVDEDGGNSELVNEEDDLMFGCPTTVQVRAGGG